MMGRDRGADAGAESLSMQSLARRRLWRAAAVASVPGLLALWALWRDVLVLDAAGLRGAGGRAALREWAALSLLTVVLAALFWAKSRALRVLGYTFYALVVSVGFGVAAVLGVAHAFGGFAGDLAAPAWALAGLAGIATAAALSLLAAAALIVDDVRRGDAEEEALLS